MYPCIVLSGLNDNPGEGTCPSMQLEGELTHEASTIVDCKKQVPFCLHRQEVENFEDDTVMNHILPSAKGEFELVPTDIDGYNWQGYIFQPKAWVEITSVLGGATSGNFSAAIFPLVEVQSCRGELQVWELGEPLVMVNFTAEAEPGCMHIPEGLSEPVTLSPSKRYFLGQGRHSDAEVSGNHYVTDMFTVDDAISSDIFGSWEPTMDQIGTASFTLNRTGLPQELSGSTGELSEIMPVVGLRWRLDETSVVRIVGDNVKQGESEWTGYVFEVDEPIAVSALEGQANSPDFQAALFTVDGGTCDPSASDPGSCTVRSVLALVDFSEFESNSQTYFPPGLSASIRLVPGTVYLLAQGSINGSSGAHFYVDAYDRANLFQQGFSNHFSWGPSGNSKALNYGVTGFGSELVGKSADVTGVNPLLGLRVLLNAPETVQGRTWVPEQVQVGNASNRAPPDPSYYRDAGFIFNLTQSIVVTKLLGGATSQEFRVGLFSMDANSPCGPFSQSGDCHIANTLASAPFVQSADEYVPASLAHTVVLRPGTTYYIAQGREEGGTTGVHLLADEMTINPESMPIFGFWGGEQGSETLVYGVGTSSSTTGKLPRVGFEFLALADLPAVAQFVQVIDTPEITNSDVAEPLSGEWQGYVFQVRERLEVTGLLGGSTDSNHMAAIFSVSDNNNCDPKNVSASACSLESVLGESRFTVEADDGFFVPDILNASIILDPGTTYAIVQGLATLLVDRRELRRGSPPVYTRDNVYDIRRRILGRAPISAWGPGTSDPANPMLWRGTESLYWDQMGPAEDLVGQNAKGLVASLPMLGMDFASSFSCWPGEDVVDFPEDKGEDEGISRLSATPSWSPFPSASSSPSQLTPSLSSSPSSWPSLSPSSSSSTSFTPSSTVDPCLSDICASGCPGAIDPCTHGCPTDSGCGGEEEEEAF
eukprot:gb/GECG01003394.1/.p1 GENE.gb/GECG01003394.1/~~gb/GECG01003394.1/.p1  ORF type:complete len:935 (+),score=89.07 gb/GECG01003394.1/:1-2805(+)